MAVPVTTGVSMQPSKLTFPTAKFEDSLRTVNLEQSTELKDRGVGPSVVIISSPSFTSRIPEVKQSKERMNTTVSFDI